MKVRGGLGVPEMSRKKGYGKRHVFFWKEALLKLPLLFIFVATTLLYDEYFEF